MQPGPCTESPYDNWFRYAICQYTPAGESILPTAVGTLARERASSPLKRWVSALDSYDGKELRIAFVAAVAKDHDEDMSEQKWLDSADINTHAPDELFEELNLKVTHQHEADTTTAPNIGEKCGNLVKNRRTPVRMQA